MTFACFALTLMMHGGCAETPPTDVNVPQQVPFTYFDTEHHHLQLELDADDLQAALVMDGRWRLELPPRQMPVEALELPNDCGLLVITRELFSGALDLLIFSSPAESAASSSAQAAGAPRASLLALAPAGRVELPARLRGNVFRQAAVYRSRVMLVLYNVLVNRNFLYRLNVDENCGVSLDEQFIYELDFNGRYEIASNIHAALVSDALILAAEGTRYMYDEKEGRPALNRVSFNEPLRIIELASDGNAAAAIYHDTQRALEPGDDPAVVDSFRIYDMLTLQPLTQPEPRGLPFNLRFENGALAVSHVDSPDDLPALLRRDLSAMDSSGVMNLGSNNLEGRVAWSQLYYLNGLIDLLANWSDERATSPALDGLKDQVRLRLDLEMALLDRLLDEGEPGLSSLRYSVERQPAIYAVQTGRILRLFKRYLEETPAPIKLHNFEKLRAMTEQLTGHQETLVTAGEGDPWVKPGRMYLKWPRGCVFPFDGVGIPFNHQNDWAGGVAHGASKRDADALHLRAARDIVSLLIDLEQLSTNPPADYQWHYWWGQARAGWTAADNVSANRPGYAGDQGLAHISYRTIDAMAILAVGRVFPDLVPPALLDYLTRAVEADGLYPLLSEELLHYHRLPLLDARTASRYLRMDSPWELQNAVWAYAAMDRMLHKKLAATE